jgi:DNA-damage-inducible protein D
LETQIIHSLTNNFESFVHKTEEGIEFWLARDLQQLLGYTEWRNFYKVILKAKTACELSEQSIVDHFVYINKMVQIGSGAIKEYNAKTGTKHGKYSAHNIYFK